jgi:hypothetical protein
MVLLGARFRALAGAVAALRAIRSSVPVAPVDVGVRPLGSTTYEAPAEDFLVAGRFEPADVETVIRILHSNGGRVVERRIDPAMATPPRTESPAPHGVRLNRRPAPPMAFTGPRTRLRRPSPPRRVRTARSHRIERALST